MGAIDRGATGAMIGGLGVWTQLAAAVIGVVVADRIGRQHATAVERAETLENRLASLTTN